MGEFVDLMIGGVLCQFCGEYIGNEVGYPQTCNDCRHELSVTDVEDQK